MRKLYFLFTKIINPLFTGKIILPAILLLSVINHGSIQGKVTNLPYILDFNFTPTIINTTDSSQTVTVTVRAADPWRGVVDVEVRFKSLAGGPIENQFVIVSLDSRHRISGDNKDGVYSAAVIFPQYSKAGAWEILDVSVSDGGFYRRYYHTIDLNAGGYATQMQVISNNEDTIPPELIDFSFTPTTIDEANGSQNVTVTIRAKDVKAGIGKFTVGFIRPNDDILFSVDIDSSNRISGDDKDGVYQKDKTFSHNTHLGIYNVSVFAFDAFSNSKYFNTAEIAGRGFTSQLQVTRTALPPVSISGRVVSANGRGISKAVVSLTQFGGVKYAVTNPFGYYRFDQAEAIVTYTLNVKHKSYSFTPQVHFINSERTNLNFTANP